MCPTTDTDECSGLIVCQVHACLTVNTAQTQELGFESVDGMR